MLNRYLNYLAVSGDQWVRPVSQAHRGETTQCRTAALATVLGPAPRQSLPVDTRDDLELDLWSARVGVAGWRLRTILGWILVDRLAAAAPVQMRLIRQHEAR